MRKGFLGLIVIAIFYLAGCGDGNVIVPTDPDVQRREDSLLIVAYFMEKGYPITDSTITENGTRYVILERGDGELIKESDNVTYDYIGALLNDTIFDTSLVEVADSIRTAVEDDITVGDTTDLEKYILALFPEDGRYEPLQLTYSESGWPFTQINLPRVFPETNFPIIGLTEGIAATFNQMSTNGTVIMVLPSSQALGTSSYGLIGPNEVITFELRPANVESQ